MFTFQSQYGWSVTGTVQEFYTSAAGQLMVVVLSEGGVRCHLPAEVISASA